MTATETKALTDVLLELSKTHVKENGRFDWKRLRREAPQTAKHFSYNGKTYEKGKHIINKLREQGLWPSVKASRSQTNNGVHAATAAMSERLMQAAAIEALVKARVKAILEDGDICSRCGGDLTHLRKPTQ